MIRNKAPGHLWLAISFWLFVAAGCTTYAYVDFKELRQTVPWISRQTVFWSAPQTAASTCPDLNGIYRRGEALYEKFPRPWGNNEQKELTIRPVTVNIQVSEQPFLRLKLPPNYTKEEWIAAAKENTKLRQQFYAETITHLSRADHSLIIHVTDNDRYNQIVSLDLRQPGIGCANGKLVIKQIFDGGIQYEGKVNEFIRARETQFQLLPNRNLEVISYDLNWYGKETGANTTEWKKSEVVYERITGAAPSNRPNH